jgi:transcriptional antiterminator RfaH
MSSFWACARLEPHREHIAEHFLGLAGFTVYLPRLRERRRRHGRVIETRPLLFPSYGFVLVVGGWWEARWSIGVSALIMEGSGPARVPDNVIAEIRSRERNGLIELPKPRLEPGARVKVLSGPLAGQIGLLGALRPHERVLVLLRLLGGERRVELAEGAIEAV